MVQVTDLPSTLHSQVVHPSEFTSTSHIVCKWSRSQTFHPLLHSQVVQPSGFTSTSHTSEHHGKHPHTGMWKTQLTQYYLHLSSCRSGGEDSSQIPFSFHRQETAWSTNQPQDIASPPFIIDHALTDKVICNALWLLLQCRLHTSSPLPLTSSSSTDKDIALQIHSPMPSENKMRSRVQREWSRSKVSTQVTCSTSVKSSEPTTRR